jgi:prepilin-type N-terminal cleavage/methylation domain-containing protein
MRRRAFTIVELLVALAVLGLVIGCVAWLFAYGGRTAKRLTPQLGAQQAGRIAVVRLLREIQEGMEVLAPAPGCTLSYALVIDKLGRVQWFHQRPQSGPSGRTELWVLTDGTAPAADRRMKLVSDLKRITFTCRSEGALQVNLALAEEDAEYPLLTTVRLRNLPSAEEVW